MYTVIYHDNCNDGIMAAYLIYRVFKAEGIQAEYIADNYNRDLPEMKGSKLLIVDFSYKKPRFDQLVNSSKFDEVIMLDHHDSTADEHDGYKRYSYVSSSGCRCEVNLQEEKSGAGITYEWLEKKFPDASIFIETQQNALLRHCVEWVQDRDLWKFQMAGTKAFHSLLSEYRESIYKVDELFSLKHEEFFKKLSNHQIVLNYKQLLFKDLASKAIEIEFQGHVVPIVNCPSQFASDVGEILYKDKPFSICYVTNKDKVILSLRSDKTKGVNVKEIAEKFGGGGHIPAAGCSLPLEKLTDLMNGKL